MSSIITRRTLLLGAAGGAMALSGCGGGSKFRTYDGPEVTRVIVWKAERRLALMHGTSVIKDYKIALGGNPVGPKRFEGDGRTPEGEYLISHRNPNSAYHLSLGISYPNEQDIAYAESMGRRPGGDIFIHGRAGKNKGRGTDWTAGCIAVKDGQIEHIYAAVAPGTPITLLA